MMRLPRFRYVVPKSVAEASRVLAGEGPDAMPVAGGTDLFPNMKRLHQTPKTVVGLSGLAELKGIFGTPAKGLVIRAGETLTDICENPVVRQAYPGLAHAVASISTPILRNMGTLGGNVCLDTRCNYYNQTYEWRKAIDFCMKKDGGICWVAPGSPRCWAVQSSDSVPILVAMRARFKLVGPRGARTVEAKDLFRDDGIQYLTKKPHEILTEIRLPAAPDWNGRSTAQAGLPALNGWRASYQKLRRRGAFDFPVLGVAACAWFGKSGVVTDARIVFGGIASSPKLAEEAARFLVGKKLTEATIKEAAALAYNPARPLDNTDFTMHWRKQMARVYAERALKEVASPQSPVAS